MILLILFTFSFANEDKKIIDEVLTAFSKQCNYISSVEENIVKKLEEEYKRAQKNVEIEVLNCYRESITEISSINYIYKNICSEITSKDNRIDYNKSMRLFVRTQKYRQGIRIQHSVLNDCLKLAPNGEDYLVNLNFNRIETKYLKGRLEEIKPFESFISNKENFR